MEKVVDVIQKNLPEKLSTTHWKVGPMSSSFDSQDDDIRAHNNAKTMTASRSTDYNLMDADEQVALATAAAAAAVAMEHEHNQRRHKKPSSHHNRPIQQLMRGAADSLDNMMHRGRATMSTVSATANGVDLDHWGQQLRQSGQQFRQQVGPQTAAAQQQMKLVLQGIRDRTPLYVNSVKTVVKTVREHVWNVDPTGSPPQYECDATGRQISSDGQYSGTLNEGFNNDQEEQELRDQPPYYYNNQNYPSFVPPRYEHVWNKFRNSQFSTAAASAIHKAATVTGTTTKSSTAAAAEYYVNFSDGNAKDAIHGAVTGTLSSQQPQGDDKHFAKRPTDDITSTGYADLQDDGSSGGAPLSHHPTPPQVVAQAQTQPQQRSKRNNNNVTNNPHWHSLREDKEELSRCRYSNNKNQNSPKGKDVRNPLHSTANYQWGAHATVPNTTAATITVSTTNSSSCQDGHEEKDSQPEEQDEDTPPEAMGILVVDGGSHDDEKKEEEVPVVSPVDQPENSDDVETKPEEDPAVSSADHPENCDGSLTTNSRPDDGENDDEDDHHHSKENLNETPSLHATAKFQWTASTCKAAEPPRVQ